MKLHFRKWKLHSLIDSFIILAHLPNTYPADSVTSRELFRIKFLLFSDPDELSERK